MGDGEAEWQVAGRRRQRRGPGGSEAGQRQQQQQQQQEEIRRTTGQRARHCTASHDTASHDTDRKQGGTRTTTTSTTSIGGASSSRKNKSGKSHGGYSYRNSKKQPPLEQVDTKELVAREIAKLQELKVLLRETALWERLAAGLRGALPRLGLTLPCDDQNAAATASATAAAAAAADTAAADALSACSGATGIDDVDSPVKQEGPRQALCELVCYGVGNFSENHSSRYQFALALCLRDLLFERRNGTNIAAATSTPTAVAAAATTPPATPLTTTPTTPTTTPPPAVSTAAMPTPPPPPPPTAAATAAKVMHSSSANPTAASAVAAAAGPAILVFDPVMGETEKRILAALGCGTLENEEGKRCCCVCSRCCREDGGGGVQRDKCIGGEEEAEEEEEEEGRSCRARPTLFFMPHCPQRLYSNVLWANWSCHALGSILILGNKISSYSDRLLGARARADPTNALLRAGPLLRDIDMLPYPASDRARWRRDVEKMPRLERAFNDLALSFSDPGARGSAEGIEALRNRPLEFVEEEDGELVTGRASERDVN